MPINQEKFPFNKLYTVYELNWLITSFLLPEDLLFLSNVSKIYFLLAREFIASLGTRPRNQYLDAMKHFNFDHIERNKEVYGMLKKLVNQWIIGDSEQTEVLYLEISIIDFFMFSFPVPFLNKDIFSFKLNIPAIRDKYVTTKEKTDFIFKSIEFRATMFDFCFRLKQFSEQRDKKLMTIQKDFLIVALILWFFLTPLILLCDCFLQQSEEDRTIGDKIKSQLVITKYILSCYVNIQFFIPVYQVLLSLLSPRRMLNELETHHQKELLVRVKMTINNSLLLAFTGKTDNFRTSMETTIRSRMENEIAGQYGAFFTSISLSPAENQVKSTFEKTSGIT